jgi:hypothetical protein
MWFYEDIQIFDKKINGYKIQRIYRSFSNIGDISTVEFMEACDIVREAIRFLSKDSMILPLPEKQYKLN